MKEKLKALFFKKHILLQQGSEANDLIVKKGYGYKEDGYFYLSFFEAFYLLEKNLIEIYDTKNRIITKDDFLNLARRNISNFYIKYRVFRDLRNKGYVVKSGLKFGSDFRVYDKGKLPGQEHAKWLVYCITENDKVPAHEFASKNRVANTTKKRILLAISDDEGSITYYEIKWLRL
ncbi:MAG: tRNA-intron endonuclease, archaea type [Candidatus Woesearchaeota archaeon]|nr:tRNA-intron endonuclease, archaea type [Candidatus Woesearchaeota archaeon]MDN5327391.1 tRNA-intron endonuclease, archaea type [Candidatus Woesearchaeota archaeon]